MGDDGRTPLPYPSLKKPSPKNGPSVFYRIPMYEIMYLVI